MSVLAISPVTFLVVMGIVYEGCQILCDVNTIVVWSIFLLLHIVIRFIAYRLSRDI